MPIFVTSQTTALTKTKKRSKKNKHFSHTKQGIQMFIENESIFFFKKRGKNMKLTLTVIT